MAEENEYHYSTNENAEIENRQGDFRSMMQRRLVNNDLPTTSDLSVGVNGYGNFREINPFNTDRFIKLSENSVTLTCLPEHESKLLASVEETVVFCLFTDMPDLGSALNLIRQIRPMTVYLLNGTQKIIQVNQALFGDLPIEFFEFETLNDIITRYDHSDTKIVIAGHGSIITGTLTMTSNRVRQHNILLTQLLDFFVGHQPKDVTFVMCHSGLITEMARFGITLPENINLSFHYSKTSQGDVDGFGILIEDYENRHSHIREGASNTLRGGKIKYKKYKTKK